MSINSNSNNSCHYSMVCVTITLNSNNVCFPSWANLKFIFVSFDIMCVLNHFFGSATNGNIMNTATNNMINTFILAFGHINFGNKKIRHISKCCCILFENWILWQMVTDTTEKLKWNIHTHSHTTENDIIWNCFTLSIVYVNYSAILRKCVALENAISRCIEYTTS